MENKINIEEYLRLCPKGMELDCTIYNGKVCFEGIDDNNPAYPIIISINEVNIEHLDIWGQYSTREYGKCIIFPKGKTTWEEFVPPCKFNDGDIITDSLGTCIFKGESECEGCVDYYCGISDGYFSIKDNKCKPWSHYGFIVNYRLSTEEEKQQLFDAIKANGYKWNAETKTLDKLPKFKVGDRIKHKCEKFRDERTITSYGKGGYWTSINDWIDYENQDDWELVPDKFDITTLVPFESRVLVRDDKSYKWSPAVWGFYDEDNKNNYPYEVVGGQSFQYCIPYNDDTKHLIGKTNDCDDFYKTWE